MSGMSWDFIDDATEALEKDDKILYIIIARHADGGPVSIRGNVEDMETKFEMAEVLDAVLFEEADKGDVNE